LPTQAIVLWKDHDVSGGPWWWTWEDKIVPLGDVKSARLTGKVFIVAVPVIGTRVEIRVNDYPVWTQYVFFWQEWFDVDVDVTPWVIEHSDNKFSIGVSQLGGATFTLTLTVEYEEEAPGIPRPPIDWMSILAWGSLAVVGALVVGYAVSRAMKKEGG